MLQEKMAELRVYLTIAIFFTFIKKLTRSHLIMELILLFIITDFFCEVFNITKALEPQRVVEQQ